MAKTMTLAEYVAQWSRIQQKETAVSQPHFNDTCHLVCHQDLLANGGQTDKASKISDRAEFDKVTRKSVGSDDIQQLDDIHKALDTDILDTYTWPHNLTDEQILERLLPLNLERAAKQEKN